MPRKEYHEKLTPSYFIEAGHSSYIITNPEKLKNLFNKHKITSSQRREISQWIVEDVLKSPEDFSNFMKSDVGKDMSGNWLANYPSERHDPIDNTIMGVKILLKLFPEHKERIEELALNEMVSLLANTVPDDLDPLTRSSLLYESGLV